MKIWNRFIAISLSYLLLIGLTGLVGAYTMGQSLGSPNLEIIGNTGLSVQDEDEIEDFFNFSNMYPGKTKTAELTVTNDNEQEPFSFEVALDSSGDDKLIDALTIKISDSEQTYYDDKPVAELGELEIGQIQPGESKVLTFALTLQTEHGNETQNKTANMQWTFIGSGALGEETGEDTGDDTDVTTPGAADPATADPDPGLTDPDATDPDTLEVTPEDPFAVPLADAPEPAPAEAADIPAEETVVVDPEAPEVAMPEEAEVLGVNYWPLLLLLLLPLLLWLLWSSRVLVMVPGRNGGYEVVARKIARPKEKQWHLNISRQLERYAAKHGYVIVDFRGRFLKDAGKVLYADKGALGSGRMRYALIGSERMVSWFDNLKDRANRVVS